MKICVWYLVWVLDPLPLNAKSSNIDYLPYYHICWTWNDSSKRVLQCSVNFITKALRKYSIYSVTNGFHDASQYLHDKLTLYFNDQLNWTFSVIEDIIRIKLIYSEENSLVGHSFPWAGRLLQQFSKGLCGQVKSWFIKLWL